MTGVFISDLRYGLRGLRQRPGFTAVVVLTLALGIGATTAIFSVVNGVLLRPLPYQRPGQLVMIWGWREQKAQAELSVPEYWELREQAHSFERVAAFADGTVNLTGSGTPERLRMGYVTMALGAVPREILVLVLSQGTWLAGLGIAAGVAGALIVTRLIGDLLFQVRPGDPATFVGTALILALVTVLASLVPALRAARVNPIETLRSE
jgi:hypothetical protein